MGGFIMKRNVKQLSFTEGLRLLDKSLNSDFQDERETARLLLHLKLQQRLQLQKARLKDEKAKLDRLGFNLYTVSKMIR